jgi:hypothetical protein
VAALDGPVLVAPVGLSFGIPPANRLPKPIGLTGPDGADIGLGFDGPDGADGEVLGFPSIIGALRSLVTAFFNRVPPWIADNNAFLSPPPALFGGAAANLFIGGGGGPGGGGGGGGILKVFVNHVQYRNRMKI